MYVWWCLHAGTSVSARLLILKDTFEAGLFYKDVKIATIFNKHL